MRRGFGCLAKLFWLPVLGVGAGVLFYVLIAITDPWAFHIGGRSTPFLMWHGSGKLHTKSGIEYPLYVNFFPSSHSSHLRMDGKRPTGGLQGSAWLCTSPGVTQYLDLTGTIYGGWRSTENSTVDWRLLEQKIFDVGQQQGFFDLVGKWDGPKLVMDDRGSYSSTFRSGLRIEHASVTLEWGNYSDFKAACASATNLPARR
jgi:hypothetical protein